MTVPADDRTSAETEHDQSEDWLWASVGETGDLKPNQQVWLYVPQRGCALGFFTGDTFRLYDKELVEVTHWAEVVYPHSPAHPGTHDFWHVYRGDQPIEDPPERKNVTVWAWLYDPVYLVRLGTWNGNWFRDYMGQTVDPTAWAYVELPAPPPAQMAAA